LARHPDALIGAALGAAALVLYLRTMPPTVLAGDSGEYQYMAYVLGVPHSTGYPLYILLAKLFTLLPVGDVAYRVNLFSVVCAALTAPFVYAVALRLIRQRVPALLATLILAVTPSVWGAAVDAEVYALHLLLGVLAIFFALRWHQDDVPPVMASRPERSEGTAKQSPRREGIASSRSFDSATKSVAPLRTLLAMTDARDPSTTLRTSFYALALVCGLGLAHHRVFVFIAPALLLVAWFNRARLRWAMLARGVLLVLLPLLLYAYIPIRASQLIAQQDPANWQLYTREDAILKGTITAYYNHTPQGIFNLVTGFDNRSKLGFKSPLDEANRVELASNLLLQQFGIVGIGLAIVGALESLRRDCKTFAILLAIAAGVGFIAIYLRGESTVYYFSLAYFALALWIGFGADVLLRLSAVSGRRSVIAMVLLLLPLTALVANFPLLDKSSNYTARDFAQAVLRDNIAPNAVVIAPWEVSQPIRYLQFVENQRTDLLVVNVPPVWPQFETMLTNAHKLNRPFYLVQFDPELKTAPGARWVQAVALPLLAEPQPRYRLSNAHVIPDVEVLGYDLEPDPPRPGQWARVSVYYRTLARMYPMYSSILSTGDFLGRPLVDLPGFPASFYYPTYRWRAGEFYRDAYAFIVPADAPNGLYNLDLNWYIYDLETRKPDYDHEYQLALGAVRVGNISATGADITHAQNARVGDAITFLGWNTQPAPKSDAVEIARGQSLNLDLFWRADRAVAQPYTVFVHLVDASGRVVADADSPPSQGLFPTDRWTVGEIVRDRHALPVRVDLATGNYTIAIGMYLPATGARLPIDRANDTIVLTQVLVK
jgi:hypothetical protein